MVVRQDREGRVTRRTRILLTGVALCVAGLALADARWCLGFSGLGPIRAGLTAEDAMALADWPSITRKAHTEACWIMPFQGGRSDFSLMIIDGKVARIEIKGESTLTTLSGARVGMTEEALKALYGPKLESQPHKYDEHGRVFVLKSSAGDHGLRFETSAGKVTVMHAGPWEHLNYVEGCG
jgi:hypothetical protein